MIEDATQALPTSARYKFKHQMQLAGVESKGPAAVQPVDSGPSLEHATGVITIVRTSWPFAGTHTAGQRATNESEPRCVVDSPNGRFVAMK